ncbi:MAG: hypothetical protein IKI76_06635 [Selenomonadaceae bacterium]|nr:hypothetical protein [Selenomonadaceae bacterium]
MEGNCIAFKLNYCDGGASSNCIGFRGLCSDTNIFYNILNRNRPWCSHDNNFCKKYLCKRISREELEQRWQVEDSGFCNESITLLDWYAEAGWNNDDTTRKFSNTDMINHLCILTTVKPYMPDSSRFVLAMFIIKDFFEGDKKNPGKVSACNHWRLEFRPNETNEMNFWDIYPGKPPWRQGLFRYFDDATAIKFLERAVEVKRGTPEENFAKEFLKQYQINLRERAL